MPGWHSRGREWDDITSEPRPCAWGQGYGKVQACPYDAEPDSDYCAVHQH